MRRTAVLGSAIVALGALATSASAGTYLGIAVGTEPSVNDTFTAATASTPSGRSLRGLVGMRFANLSVEGAVNGFGVTLPAFGAENVYQASLSLKLSLPLGNNFEAFGRGGLERTWLTLGDAAYDYTGDGYQLGAGFEFKLDTTLANTTQRFDATSGMWGLGVTIGI
jgi:Outer membrane protein beta-barrel domain